jgi:RNA polymerase sigma factor (sigma-70 family)
LDKIRLDSDFLALLNEYRGAIRRVSRTYAASSGDREDLVQEIVYQLWRAFPSYRRESTRLTWVYRIALNTAITGLRRRARQPVQVPFEPCFDVPAPPASAGSEARTELLYRVIRSLSEVDRALVMCYLEGLNYKQIAVVLGISETNVGARLSRTKAKLQALVRGMESFNGSRID